MKQLKYFLFVAALAVAVTGCRKPVEVSLETSDPTIVAEGGSVEVALKSNGAWTISPVEEWLTVSPMSGSGDATLTLTAEANMTGVERSAEIKATTKDNSASLTVKQSAVDEPLPTDYLTVNLEEFECGSEGAEFTVEVSSNIDWIVTAPDWIISSVTEGSNDATVTLTVKPIDGEISGLREADVFFGSLLASDKVHVIQTVDPIPPDPHFLEVSPLEFQFGKDGGESEITIGCDTTWLFDLDCEWLSLSQESGTGNATVVLTAAPNAITEPRAVSFHIKSGMLNYQFSVRQEAGDIPLVIDFSVDTIYAAYTGELKTVTLTSNTSWQLQVSEWITLLTNSGQGDASFDIIVDGNSSPDERVGFVNAIHNGQVLATLVVVQEGKPNILEVDFTELDVRPEGGEIIIHVTSNQAWTVNTDVDWLHCNPQSGFGNGTFTITVDASASPRPREGHVKVSGETGIEVIITITQHQ